MPTSVRLDPETERLLARLARKRSQSKSDVIREAIESLSRQDVAVPEDETVLESISDLIGCVDGGPPNLSERTGEKFRELLTKKSRSSS